MVWGLEALQWFSSFSRRWSILWCTSSDVATLPRPEESEGDSKLFLQKALMPFGSYQSDGDNSVQHLVVHAQRRRHAAEDVPRTNQTNVQTHQTETTAVFSILWCTSSDVATLPRTAESGSLNSHHRRKMLIFSAEEPCCLSDRISQKETTTAFSIFWSRRATLPRCRGQPNQMETTTAWTAESEGDTGS